MLSIKKYANGGTNANGEKLAQIFSTAASKLGIEPEALIKKAQELQGDAQVGFVQALQDIAENDNPNPQSVQIVQNLFSKSQAFKKGGKIEQFICKHAKGGKANCGCMDDGGKVEKAEDGTAGVNSKLPGFKQAKKNAKRAPYENIGRRRFGTYVDENGNTYAYEWGDVNGSTAETFVLMQPNDTVGTQFISTKYGDMPVNFNQKSDSWKNSIGARFRASVPVKQEGGQVEKAQEGSILDYYSNKWSNDLARVKSGWNKFKESAPGKVLGAFMPNPNSETGMLSAAVPIGKIKVIPEGKIGSLRRAKYDPFVWEVIAKDPVVLENAKKLGLREGSSEWANFIEKTAKEINDLARLERGGKVEKAQDGMYVRPDNLTRREALELSREHYGYDRAQSRMAYANAINALRNQGFSGRELRQQARRMVAGYNDGSRDLNNRPEQIPTKSIFAQSIDGRVYPQSTMNKALLWGAGPGISAQNMEDRIQQNMDANNFSNAFGMARAMGRKTFNWRGNNYGTKLASEVMPRIDTDVVLEDIDIPAMEFEPIPNNVTAPSEVATVATARPEIVERTAEIITPGLQSANGNLQNFVPGVMRGSSPYMELRPGENVPRSWYMGPRPVVTRSVQGSAASSSQSRPRYSAITGQRLNPGQSEYDLW